MLAISELPHCNVVSPCICDAWRLGVVVSHVGVCLSRWCVQNCDTIPLHETGRRTGCICGGTCILLLFEVVVVVVIWQMSLNNRWGVRHVVDGCARVTTGTPPHILPG